MFICCESAQEFKAEFPPQAGQVEPRLDCGVCVGGAWCSLCLGWDPGRALSSPGTVGCHLRGNRSHRSLPAPHCKRPASSRPLWERQPGGQPAVTGSSARKEAVWSLRSPHSEPPGASRGITAEKDDTHV